MTNTFHVTLLWQALGSWRALVETDVAPPFSAITVAKSVEQGALLTHKLTFPPRDHYLLEEDAEEDAIKLEVPLFLICVYDLSVQCHVG